MKTLKQGLALALAALSLAPIIAIAQEGQAPAMDSAMAAMMAEWEQYSTPGPEHQTMAKGVGTWNCTTTMWMDTTAPPTVSQSTCVVTPLLGGRFFRSDYKGDFMGMPFEGIAISGYDNYKKKYIGSWIDNMGTMMMTFEGTCNADGSECTFTTSFDDPMTKTRKRVREVCRYTSVDSWTMDWYETSPGQPERMTMQIVHTRVK